MGERGVQRVGEVRDSERKWPTLAAVPELETRLPVREIGGLGLDPATQSVEVSGTEILLTRTEFGVLWLLSERPGRAVHRYELLDSVWGSAVFVDPGSLSVCVCRLRRKVQQATGEACSFIETVHGVGYRLVAWRPET